MAQVDEGACVLVLELYTAVLPAVFSVSVFCRYQICWIFGISVGIVPPFLIPKCTDRVFLRYRYGIYREIPTEYRPKIPIRDTTLVSTRIRKMPVWEIFRKLALIPGNVRTYPKVCVGKRLEYR